ncbi:cation:proton antiporter [Streptomyces sp. NPDC059256]|uniref:cation:proton antiporter n=1 Tax=Streptomyces sp. NPDC059256 TaxID=3346794 RepID=UPI0036CC64B1
MSSAEFFIRMGHVLAVLCGVLLVVAAGRFAARKAHQPEVVGELTAGLLAGPAAVWLLGHDTFDAVVPKEVLSVLKLTAQAGLVLFLVGLTHELRSGAPARMGRAAAWVSAGALVPALGTGALLAGWVLLTDDEAVRGTAPTAALVLVLAVSLSVTAVPVLARILTDRGMFDTGAGRLSLTAALVTDCVSWLLLSVAVGLGSGSLAGFLRAMATFVCGVLVAALLRLVLRKRVAEVLCRRPWVPVLLTAGIAMGMAAAMEHLGMTAILGAALAGLAVPVTDGWESAVARVSRAGRALVPVFFVVTGITVLTAGFGSAPITLIGAALVLGIAGKTVGGYAGARLGGQGHWDALRIGSLMNTRGLTELIVLHAAYEAGLLTAPLFLALVVMALVTTAMTGPALLAVDRAEMRHRQTALPPHTVRKGDGVR